LVNRNKIKGTGWENLLVKLLKEHIPKSDVKRIPNSGALGSAIGEPLLQGDVRATFPGLNKKFRIEAKVGYGGAEQLTVKRDWINKIKEEAGSLYAYPLLACKFSGSRKTDGVQYFFILDFDTFVDLMNYIGKVAHE